MLIRSTFFFAGMLQCAPYALAEPGPIDAFKAYTAAVKADQWDDVARLYDPSGLKQFRKLFSYFDTRSDSESGEQMRRAFFGPDATQASTAKLSDEKFFAAYIKTSSETVGVMISGPAHEAYEHLRIVGSLADGSDTAHVVFHVTMPVDEFLDPERKRRTALTNVVTLKKVTDGSWRLVVTDQLLTGAESIAKVLTEK